MTDLAGEGRLLTHSRRNAWLTVLAICAIALAVNLATASRSPTIGTDEVMFVDPGVNLAAGHGFVSSAWAFQPIDQRFTANSPVYPLLLAGWLKIVWTISGSHSITPLATRSLNYVLMAAVVLMLHSTAWRRNWIRSAGMAGVLTALLWCGYSISFSYRSGRYDIIGLFWFAGMALASTLHRPTFRRVSIALFALPLAATGLQCLPYAGLIGLAVLLIGGWRWLPEVIAAGIGSGFGAIAMFADLRMHGLMEPLTKSIAELGPGGFHLRQKLYLMVGSLYADLSCLAICIGAIAALALLGGSKAVRNSRRLLLITALLGVGLPAMMALVGKYVVYYGWMGFVPTAIGAVTAAGQLKIDGASKACKVAVGLFIAAALVPLPGRMVVTSLQWQQRDYAAVDRFIAAHVNPEDRAWCAFAAYYPTKRIAKFTVLQPATDMLTARQRDEITVLVLGVNEAVLPSLSPENWTEVARLEVEADHRPPVALPYALRIMRRTNPPP